MSGGCAMQALCTPLLCIHAPTAYRSSLNAAPVHPCTRGIPFIPEHKRRWHPGHRLSPLPQSLFCNRNQIATAGFGLVEALIDTTEQVMPVFMRFV